MNPLSSVGTGELIFILIIALIFLGPERLPEIARGIAKAIRQFRETAQGMSAEFGEELASMQEATRDIKEGLEAVQDVRKLPQTLVSAAAAPLTEALDPIKSAAEEVKAATALTPAHIGESAEPVTESEESDPPSSAEDGKV